MAKASTAIRADIYTEVTNKIIAQLEAGVAPWAQPWSAGTASALPCNAGTGRRYSGVNVLILWSAAQESGFTSSRWLTFKQASDLGGSVRKGSKATSIVFASQFVPEKERAAKGDDAKAVAFLKRFCVFNLDQIDGLDHLRGDVVVNSAAEIVEAGEEIIEASGVEFRVAGDKAFYVPSMDFVQVPHRTAFFEPINYYRTALHELAHATGHASRLGRNFKNEFGSKDYAREELVAEMGSAFVCASVGIVPTVRHADYIGSWLQVLREDNRAIFKAASAASKAADWLLSRVAADAEIEEMAIAA